MRGILEHSVDIVVAGTKKAGYCARDVLSSLIFNDRPSAGGVPHALVRRRRQLLRGWK